MLFIPSCLLRADSKKEAPPQEKWGDYFKFYYCGCCGYAIHDRTLKNVECCAKCGAEPMVRTVGRWKYTWAEGDILDGYKAESFHRKGT